MTKIMLVEDDNNLREIYEARLAAEGYEIVSAQDGEAALALASKERPDMIISDIMMPKISGFEMLDILRNTDSLKNVKIIMLTALGQIEDSARASSLGADRYLVKSQVTLEDIVKAAHDLLDDASPSPAVAAPAAATEPVSVAPPVETAPAVVAAPAEPASEPEPAPEPAPAPDSTASAAPEPTAAATVPQPAPTPAPIRSIPVQDYVADESPAADSESAEPDSSPNLHPISNLPVAPEPVDEPKPAEEPQQDDDAMPDLAQSIVPAPVPDDTQDTSGAAVPSDDDDTSDAVDQPANDFTSPASFNTFQAPPTVPDIKEDIAISVEPQTSATEEASIKAQIDEFINQTAPAEESPAAAPEATDLDQPAPAAPAAEEPFVQEPVAEELDTMAAPIISAPGETEIPEPKPVEVPVSEPSADDTRDAMMSSAADQLEVSSAPASPANQDDTAADAVTGDEAPSVPSTDTKLRTITPLDAEPKKSLDQLLELEDAKTSAQQAAAQTSPPASPPQNRPNVNAYNPAAQITPPPQPPSSVDPNSISL